MLGHANCGAIAATLEILEKREQAPGDIAALPRGPTLCTSPACSRAQRLCLLQRFKDRKLKIVGAVHDLNTGRVAVLD